MTDFEKAIEGLPNLENDRQRAYENFQLTAKLDQENRVNRREHLRLVLAGFAVVLVVAMLLTGIGLLVHTLRVPPSVFTEREANCVAAGGQYLKLEGQSQWTCVRTVAS